MVTKKRTMKVGIYHIQAVKSWHSAQLKFFDQTGTGAPREVTIEFDRPADIQYLRSKLDEIVADWQEQLEDL
jgi:hypothetical protein